MSNETLIILLFGGGLLFGILVALLVGVHYWRSQRQIGE